MVIPPVYRISCVSHMKVWVINYGNLGLNGTPNTLLSCISLLVMLSIFSYVLGNWPFFSSSEDFLKVIMREDGCFILYCFSFFKLIGLVFGVVLDSQLSWSDSAESSYISLLHTHTKPPHHQHFVTIHKPASVYHYKLKSIV